MSAKKFVIYASCYPDNTKTSLSCTSFEFQKGNITACMCLEKRNDESCFRFRVSAVNNTETSENKIKDVNNGSAKQ